MHCLQQIHVYTNKFLKANIGHARSAQSTPTRIPSHARLSNRICAVATPICTPPSSMETPKLPNITKGTPLSQGPNDDELLKIWSLLLLKMMMKLGKSTSPMGSKDEMTSVPKLEAEVTSPLSQLQSIKDIPIITSYPDPHHPHPQFFANPLLNQRDSLSLPESNAMN